jgi:hypothetical protein
MPEPGIMPRHLLAEGGVQGWIDFKNQAVPEFGP